MDSFFLPILLFVGIGGIGWLLGVIGFFRAASARAEVAELRRRLDQLALRPVEPAETAPVSAMVEPEPVVDPLEIGRASCRERVLRLV